MKNFKKLLLLTIIMSVSFSVHSQINVGKSRSPINLYVSNHKSELFDDLKSKPLVFVVPASIDQSGFEKIIDEVWTSTEKKFVSEDDYVANLESYIKPEYSVLRLIDNVYNKIKGSDVVAEYISFKFMLMTDFKDIKKDKKDKLRYKYTNVAEIFFTPNIRLRQDISKKTRIGSMDAINEKYGEEPGFYNYDLGYMKNYFQFLNTQISLSQNFKIEDGVEKEEELKKLQTKELFMPEWMLKKYNALAASYGKTREQEEIFEKYDFKYNVIDNESLNQKILNGDDFYYLMHTQFNQKKIISVIHSVSGDILYLKQDGSYNLKSSDLKSINKLVK